MKNFSLLASCLLLTGSALADVKPFTPPPAKDNLALGKSYTFTPAPNYGYTLDEGDAVQLTDGKYTSESGGFWTQLSTVGVSTAELISITIDLGKVENIRGFSYHMAAGRAGVEWPQYIRVFTSIDKKEWAYVGDLYAQSVAERGEPAPLVYQIYHAASLKMPSKGRYVAFLLRECPYAFVDEIEVYRSSKDESKALASYEKTTAPETMDNHLAYRTHLTGNLDVIEKNLKAAPKAKQGALTKAFAALRKEADRAAEASYIDKLTVLPISDFQRKVWAFNSKALQVNGFQEPTFWHNCRWDNLSPVAMPAKAELVTAPVKVDMMQNEVRSEAVNLMNPADQPRKCTLTVKGFPADAKAELRQVIFTDTKEHVGVSGALKPWTDGKLELEIPAGTSTQVWITFRKPALAAGKYAGEIVADFGGKTVSAPIALNVRNLAFDANAPRMHISGFDYIQNEGGLYYKMGDFKTHIRAMRECGVDGFWAAVPAIPYGAEFDAEGNLVHPEKIHWENWEKWMENCPGARLYCIFVVAQPKFYDEPMGTPRFKKMVGDFYREWFKGIEARGLKKENIVLLLVDETITEEQEKTVVAYADAIYAAVPEAVVFADPIHANPEEGLKAMYEAVNILSPNATTLLSMGKPFRDFYANQRAAGRRIWLYSCSNAPRTLDPVAYYRAISWELFDLGGDGISFWAFGCGGGIGDSWHAYAQTGTEYSPYFVSPTDTMAAKQSEAILEGAEDFEYLSMLKESVEKCEKAGTHKDVVAEAKKFLTEAASLVTADYDRTGPNPTMPNAIQWSSPKDRSVTDKLCVKILDLLEKLQ